MRSSILILAVWSILILSCGEQSTAPSLPVTAALEPEFRTRAGTQVAGTAFLLASPLDGAPLIVTAHHVLGEAGGFPRDYEWHELGTHLQSVRAFTLPDRARTVHGEGVLLLRGAKSFDGAADMHLDLAAIPAEGALSADCLQLAEHLPREGETVWLVAQVYGGASPEQILHPARILATTPRNLTFELPAALELAGCSGGALVNAAGDVLGVFLASGTPAGGFQLGYASAAPAIRTLLLSGEKALPATPR